MKIWGWKITVGAFFLPYFALATEEIIGSKGTTAITLINPLACSDLVCIGKAVITALYIISIPIVAIMVIVGAFQILTAAGDPEKFKTGRKTIIYAVIGFVVIILAFSITELIKNLLGVKP